MVEERNSPIAAIESKALGVLTGDRDDQTDHQSIYHQNALWNLRNKYEKHSRISSKGSKMSHCSNNTPRAHSRDSPRSGNLSNGGAIFDDGTPVTYKRTDNEM